MRRLEERRAARQSAAGYVSQGALRSRDGVARNRRRAAVQVAMCFLFFFFVHFNERNQTQAKWDANRAALKKKLDAAPLIMKGLKDHFFLTLFIPPPLFPNRQGSFSRKLQGRPGAQSRRAKEMGRARKKAFRLLFWLQKLVINS
jgi:hypothetical protein